MAILEVELVWGTFTPFYLDIQFMKLTRVKQLTWREESVSAGVCYESEEVPLIIISMGCSMSGHYYNAVRKKESWKRRPQQRIGLHWWRCLSVSHSVTVPAGVLPWYSLSATVAAPLHPVDTNIFTTLDKRLLNHRHQVECKVGNEMPDFSDLVISI